MLFGEVHLELAHYIATIYVIKVHALGDFLICGQAKL